jgi:L-serine dehydratase
LPVFESEGGEIAKRTCASAGGGLVVAGKVAVDGSQHKVIAAGATVLPDAFKSGADMARKCECKCKETGHEAARP